MPSTPTQKILPLTSLRFLAAVFVVLYHMESQVPWLSGSGFFARVIALGYISVSFFFVLSGFVLTLGYLENGRLLKLSSFMTARFARIYPALFACLCLDLPHFIYGQIHVIHSGWRVTLEAIVIGFLALGAWFPRMPGLDFPSWSIAAEFFFYLCFPLMAPFLWRLRSGWIWIVTAALWLGNMGLIAALHPQPGIAHPELKIPLTHLAEFLFGICLARIYRNITLNAASRERLRRWAPALAFVSLAAFLAIPWFQLPFFEPQLGHSLLAPIFALAILAFSAGNRGLNAPFSAKWCVLLGEASFSLYLLHAPLLFLVRMPIKHHPYAGPPLLLAVAIGLSVLSFLYLEDPARLWILARTRNRSRESVATQALAQ